MSMLPVVGMMRVKNEARWIDQCIRSLFPVASHVYVLDDHSTDNTSEIAAAIPDVTVYQNKFTGLNEARDKDYLLSLVLEECMPSWIIHIDGDEELEPDPRKKAALEAVLKEKHRTDVTVLQFQVCYLWDSPFMWRTDGLYGMFFRPSVFRVPICGAHKLRFQCTNGTTNFHCSNFPQGLGGRIEKTRTRLKHYGYMSSVDRESKYQYYTKLDPKNEAEDNYRHIVGKGRYAPFDPVVIPWQD